MTIELRKCLSKSPGPDYHGRRRLFWPIDGCPTATSATFDRCPAATRSVGSLPPETLGGVKVRKNGSGWVVHSDLWCMDSPCCCFMVLLKVESQRIRHVLIRCKLQPSKNQEKTHVTCLQPSVMHCNLHVIILVHKQQESLPVFE